mmetsp:Transcript_30895/g.98631  ORF Transcript_30895/g.98631 Transcript_30895/m.98631 type:complete len:231 (+) Transcript_30895:608-1300(+)
MHLRVLQDLEAAARNRARSPRGGQPAPGGCSSVCQARPRSRSGTWGPPRGIPRLAPSSRRSACCSAAPAHRHPPRLSVPATCASSNANAWRVTSQAAPLMPRISSHPPAKYIRPRPPPAQPVQPPPPARSAAGTRARSALPMPRPPREPVLGWPRSPPWPGQRRAARHRPWGAPQARLRSGPLQLLCRYPQRTPLLASAAAACSLARARWLRLAARTLGSPQPSSCNRRM